MTTTNHARRRAWWHPSRYSEHRRNWQERLRRLSTIEFAVAGLTLCWQLLALWPWPYLLVLSIPASIALHVAAAENGNQLLLWTSTMTLALTVLVAANVVDGLDRPVALTVGMLVVLAYNELLRLHHARRRWAEVEVEVYKGSGIGFAALVATSVAGLALIQVIEGREGSWLWMFGAVSSLLVTALLLTVVPGRIAPKGTGDRWQPGERLPPHRLEEPGSL